mmetsp:Transcript_161771/g.310710  ORF Transcript_161771/g.310710 Transcript_161771/m.310710 type:complete len:339 (-) Transcript_161771:44-1060(-)
MPAVASCSACKVAAMFSQKASDCFCISAGSSFFCGVAEELRAGDADVRFGDAAALELLPDLLPELICTWRCCFRGPSMDTGGTSKASADSKPFGEDQDASSASSSSSRSEVGESPERRTLLAARSGDNCSGPGDCSLKLPVSPGQAPKLHASFPSLGQAPKLHPSFPSLGQRPEEVSGAAESIISLLGGLRSVSRMVGNDFWRLEFGCFLPLSAAGTSLTCRMKSASKLSAHDSSGVVAAHFERRALTVVRDAARVSRAMPPVAPGMSAPPLAVLPQVITAPLLLTAANACPVAQTCWTPLPNCCCTTLLSPPWSRPPQVTTAPLRFRAAKAWLVEVT